MTQRHKRQQITSTEEQALGTCVLEEDCDQTFQVLFELDTETKQRHYRDDLI